MKTRKTGGHPFLLPKPHSATVVGEGVEEGVMCATCLSLEMIKVAVGGEESVITIAAVVAVVDAVEVALIILIAPCLQRPSRSPMPRVSLLTVQLLHRTCMAVAVGDILSILCSRLISRFPISFPRFSPILTLALLLISQCLV